MKLSLLFARRYLFSKKSQNAINYIAGISVLGFTVGAMAMVIILSIMNGMEDMALSTVSHFDPDIKVTAVKGKVFLPESAAYSSILKLEGVKDVVESLEENGVAQYNGQQDIIRIKGLSPNFITCSGLDTFVYRGEFVLQEKNYNYALVGGAIAYRLDIDPANPLHTLGLVIPRRNTTSMGEGALSQLNLYPSGLFSLEEEVDNKYILVPLRFARELLDYEKEVSSLEVYVKPGVDVDDVRNEIRKLAGEGFEVLNRHEQQPLLYRIFRIEKWATFAILAFVMLIAAFNVIGSLTMLVLEKKKDITLLQALGMRERIIRAIFLNEGLLISFFGALLGMALGLLICWLQLETGFITYTTGDGGMPLPYPLKVLFSDCLLVGGTSLFLGLVTSVYPALRSTRQELPRLA